MCHQVCSHPCLLPILLLLLLAGTVLPHALCKQLPFMTFLPLDLHIYHGQQGLSISGQKVAMLQSSSIRTDVSWQDRPAAGTLERMEYTCCYGRVWTDPPALCDEEG